MLRLPPFQYLRPHTVDEALAALVEHGGDAMPVAGGTDLVPNMKRRQFEPGVLVGLSGIEELRGLESRGDVLHIGAGTTLHELVVDGTVREGVPALSRAAALVANPQIQRMGTLGGNLCVDTRCNYYNQTREWRRSIGYCMKKDGDICLVAPGSSKCWAISSSDTAPVLIALRGRVVLASPRGRRTVPVESLYRDDGIDYLARQPDELLVSVQVLLRPGTRATYRKVRRRGSFDFPLLGVAAALRTKDRVVTDARLVLGAVHTHPVVVDAAPEILVGSEPDGDALAAVAEAAAKAAVPLDNADLTLYWRKKVTRVEVRRALEELLGD